jgi:hypothetical protein
MYVINPEILNLDTLYACNKTVADWLTYTRHIPFLSHDAVKQVFYYTKTNVLKEALANMPMTIKLLALVS